MLKTTRHQTNYWKNRQIDWGKHYTDSWDHPHRKMLVWMIEKIPFTSLWEIGVGGGANLVAIAKGLQGKQLGGSDVNADAIEKCRSIFNNGLFHVEPGNDLMMSDKSVDVVLSDMTLIYVGPFQIDSYLAEMKRVARNYVVLCEFHSTSWWKRQLARFRGYHVYNYRKRMEDLGYYNIMVQRIPEEFWPGTDKNTEFRYIITAQV